MSSRRQSLRIACPVCRREQPAQPTCERCGADLGLLARAAEEAEGCRSRLATAVTEGQAAAILLEAERLQLLAGHDPAVAGLRELALAALNGVRLPAGEWRVEPAWPTPVAAEQEGEAPAGPTRAERVADWLRRRRTE